MRTRTNALLYALQLLCVIVSVMGLVSSVETKNIFGVSLNSFSLGLNIAFMMSHMMTDKLFDLLDDSQKGWKHTLDAWSEERNRMYRESND